MTTASDASIRLLGPLVLAGLQRRMHGDLLISDTPGYEEQRHVTNRRFDRRPALIARCLTSQDVALMVSFAQEQGLEVAVRSGGHSLAGHSVSEGGLLIDLSQMRRITVDPLQRVARVQPGATNGELVLATAAYGLATTTGTCATVGMGGSTLGGGLGWLMGRFGATVDNVLAFELITADGVLISASADQHPDLFWALRGGGGNFGVVTAITYQLYPLGPVLGGPLIFPIAAAASGLRMYRELTSCAPDELLAHAVLTTVPNIGPALIIQALYSGQNLAAGEQLLAPMRRCGLPVLDLITARSYAQTYMMLTPPMLSGASWYDTAYTLRTPNDTALDTLLACFHACPSPIPIVNIHQVHGAATRVAPDATAFALREPHYAVGNIAVWLQGSGEAEIGWAQQSKIRMQPYASRGLYVNFLGEEGADAVRDAYRGNYERLVAIKARYDPHNFFRRNQNIPPC